LFHSLESKLSKDISQLNDVCHRFLLKNINYLK
jgi:hypothetical protein